MEDDSRDPEQVSCQEQLIQPLTLCGGCPAQYLVTKSSRAISLRDVGIKNSQQSQKGQGITEL